MPTPRSREDFLNLLDDLKSDGANSMVMQSKCDRVRFHCNQCERKWIPDDILLNKSILLQGHFDLRNELKTLQELRMIGKEVRLELSASEVEWVEQCTRDQFKSDLWNWVRIGRITASILKSVVNASNEFPPPKRCTLRSICHPYGINFETPATLYGRRNEPFARQHLIKLWAADHQNGVVSECGIFLNCEYPYMAATPDAIGSCTCCGKFAVEIKCPFRLDSKSNLDKQLSISDLAGKPNSFLRFHGEQIELNPDHEYFYQVQAQIFLTNADFGLFVVWSKRECVILKIQKHFELWNRCVERSHLYFKKIIMPELLGNFYTKDNQ
ncbi:uncharacterized protein LOC110674771 [Aedes aegypti]|uniref:YqaJ viral recombinase domain-containing protein n=1 Tax=Aedes aegypti TaxID=7159 RepID=A0A6I8U814_AEDAE|nr:uncharacterized protein LOC110674771 [Aedes aegypti]